MSDFTSYLTFHNKLLYHHIRRLQKRITQLLREYTEHCYLDFINVYPDLTLRVPQVAIASYLGITP